MAIIVEALKDNNNINNLKIIFGYFTFPSNGMFKKQTII